MKQEKRSPAEYVGIVLSFLPLIVTLIVLPFLPNLVPAHYGTSTVDRWGSKYELLILPLLEIVFTFLLNLFDHTMLKNNKSNTEEQKKNIRKVCDILLICTNIVFNVLCYLFLFASLHQIKNLSSIHLGYYRILVIILAVSDIILGNVLPKCKRDSFIGIRVKWTLANDDIWNKTHRFGGKLYVLTGLAVLALCAFLPESPLLLYLYLASVVLEITVSCVYAYKTYAKMIKKKGSV